MNIPKLHWYHFIPVIGLFRIPPQVFEDEIGGRWEALLLYQGVVSTPFLLFLFIRK